MNKCFSSHLMMHLLIGLGLGFFAAGFVPSLWGSNGVSFGLVLVAAGFLGDFLVNNTKGKGKN